MANGVTSKTRSLGFLLREHGLEALYFSALVATFVLLGDFDTAALAQDPFGAITTKAEAARDQVVIIGQAASGLIAAVLFFLAIFKVVNWMWVGLAVVGAAGLSAIGPIQEWLIN